MTRRIQLAAVVLFVLAGAVGIGAGAARAGFPGTNGYLAFTRAVAVGSASGPQTQGVAVARPDGGDERLVTSAGGYIDTEVGWSADGRRLVFARAPDQNRTESDVFVINADGTGLARVTNSGSTTATTAPGATTSTTAHALVPTGYPGTDTEPAWSPDGTRIVFSSSRSGNRDIWVINVDGTNPVRITTASTDDVDPQWSPDGTRIAYVNLGGTAPTVHTVAPDGSSDAVVTNGECPDWAPNSQELVFGRRHNIGSASPNYDFHRIRRDGTNEQVVRINDNAVQTALCTISWSPDGTMFAYSRFSPGLGSSFVALMTVSGADAPGGLSGGAGFPDWGVAHPTQVGTTTTTSPGGTTSTTSATTTTSSTTSTTVAPNSVVRRSGADRIETAIAASRGAFNDGAAQSVVLARADVFADGLAGAPLAVFARGPMLLSTSENLDSRAEAEIQRVLRAPGRVHMLGGPAALAPAVETRLRSLGYEVSRHAGPDRYETAVRVAEALGNPGAVVLARGDAFPDALAAGPAASSLGGAVLLTAGPTMPPSTAAYLSSHNPSRYAIGGAAAAADPGAEAVVGADRFDTSARVASRFFGSPARVGLANGLAFPDALAGGADMGSAGPLLLTAPTSLPTSVRDYLSARRGSVDSLVVYGGGSAVSDAVAEDARSAIT